MNAKHINAISDAVVNILHEHFELKAETKTPKAGTFSIDTSEVNVILGVSGDLEGQIILSTNTETTKGIVSTMMGGMPVPEVNDLVWSGIREFGNWVAGATATNLGKDSISIDVTTPLVNEGFSKYHAHEVFLTIPFDTEIGEIEIHISVRATKKHS